ncbi:DUF2786 domain-containing protein [Dietzia sp. 179-F 9C3 NHS]|uniref:DUF2786 domain-containing protein n=1 Tax=Dietzia sp. 179-F 9C3 NHS TaxID=3374295 RepID=UPI0038795284
MSNEKMLDRIRKLFAKAEATLGTPESDVFMQKAMDLMAKHGIDETLARSGGDLDASEIITKNITITGKYQVDQIVLVGHIASTLHCQVLRDRDAGGHYCVIVGARRHVDRVTMLAGFLQGLMLSRAARTRSPYPQRVSTKAHRKSFMAGFTLEVGERLAAAERTAMSDSGDSTGVEVVLASDADRAAAEFRRQFPNVRNSRPRRYVDTGIEEGRAAAADVDLGQTRVGGNRLELTA